MRSIPPLNAQPLVMFQTLINQLSSLASLGPKSSLKLSPVRRIVAGHDEEGRGNIRSDDPIAPKVSRLAYMACNHTMFLRLMRRLSIHAKAG